MASKITTAAKQNEIANVVECIPSVTPTAVAKADTNAECELGIPPVEINKRGLHSFFVRTRIGTLTICANKLANMAASSA